MASTSPKVIIMLATWNGAKFLPEQLASYRAQTHANWELLVSDDGSTDGTVEMIKHFAMGIPQRVVVRDGPRQGFWRNFVSLVRNDDIDGDLFAYSDQDDIWYEQKLADAVSWFESLGDDKPALYFTRTELIEADGTAAGFSPISRVRRAFGMRLCKTSAVATRWCSIGQPGWRCARRPRMRHWFRMTGGRIRS
ncbi:glycosyltransferase [Bradyrhizobium sp.]|uniref:glycosyltransferase n=1 Tax=Bradyrhizobium sp. TaxID=376 RepID=UPI003D0F1D9B